MPGLGLVMQIWSFVKGSSFFWKLVKNYGVIKNSFEVIEGVFVEMAKRGDKTPSSHETQVLLKAVSNLLKTGVIDIPGVDEYEVALGMDKISETMQFSLVDMRGNKIVKIPMKGKRK